MGWLIHHMADGDAFVTCAALLLVFLPVLVLFKRSWAVLIALLAVTLSAIVIGLSSIPLPRWGYGFWMLLLVVIWELTSSSMPQRESSQ